MKIIKIANIKTNQYQMWYRFDKSISQKVFIVNDTIVKPTDKIDYICDACNKMNNTILRTFNDRVMVTYNDYDFICNSCVRKRVHLSEFEKVTKNRESKKKELLTKTKNKTRTSDILQRDGKLGFIGKSQEKGSNIRIKMNNTKVKNNSNTSIGTDAYNKRLKTYNNFSEDKRESIKIKQLITKIGNGTDAYTKVSNGERFGFVNMDAESRQLLSVKIDKILSEKDRNGVSKYSYGAQKRVKVLQEKGLIIKDEDKSYFDLYKQKVWFWTNKNDLTRLPNSSKRGRADLKDDAYHLDHKISMFYGFKNNIPSFIIGNVFNLEFIPHSINCQKQFKCSQTIENLIEKIKMSSIKMENCLGTPKSPNTTIVEKSHYESLTSLELGNQQPSL